MKTKLLVTCLLILSLTGCRLGPRYQTPFEHTPERWKNSCADCSEDTFVGDWWAIFGDATLDDLEAQAICNNPTLYVALERIVEARALASATGSALFPQLKLNPAYQDVGQLFKLYLPGALPAGANFPSVFRIHALQYSLPLNLSYELDLWGKLRAQQESAFADFEAKEEAYRTTLLTLTSDLANAYFLLRSLDTQINLWAQAVKIRGDYFDLIQQRYTKGLSNQIDVTNAQVDLANVEAQYLDIQRQRMLQENAIATLTGVPATCFCMEPLPLVCEPPTVPPSLPSTVMLQRPDIAQAEREMASSSALIGVAYASFFPSLTLTGALGYQSPDLGQFLKWISRYWAMGAAVSQTVFDGGRNCAELEIAYARFRQANGNYQQRVLVAFQEVEDALNNLQMEEQQFASLDKAASAAKQTAGLYANRFDKGLGNSLDVINSEKTAIDTQLNASILLGIRYVSTVQLIKALGGGW